ncbi:MAG TPA: dienelactone hydrolase family protein [Acidimicrobiales bacterium]|nr:dienelactone hydrolase family protein [Acidimicrobiales bacterium]
MRGTLPSGTAYECTGPPNPEGLPVDLGVVIAPDIFGLRPLFDDMCTRLSEDHGWPVVAVEPFPGEEDLDMEGRRAAVAKKTDDRQLGDLIAAADVTGCNRVAVIGFCMGGMYAFKAAGTGRFDKAVSFYGMIRVPDEFKGPGQGEPLDFLAREGACPTLAILGGKDHFTPPEDIDALKQLPHVEAVVYPEGEHGFVHDPSRPTHRADDAADAWSRVIQFLIS